MDLTLVVRVVQERRLIHIGGAACDNVRGRRLNLVEQTLEAFLSNLIFESLLAEVNLLGHGIDLGGLKQLPDIGSIGLVVLVSQALKGVPIQVHVLLLILVAIVAEGVLHFEMTI